MIVAKDLLLGEYFCFKPRKSLFLKIDSIFISIQSTISFWLSTFLKRHCRLKLSSRLYLFWSLEFIFFCSSVFSLCITTYIFSNHWDPQLKNKAAVGCLSWGRESDYLLRTNYKCRLPTGSSTINKVGRHWWALKSCLLHLSKLLHYSYMVKYAKLDSCCCCCCYPTTSEEWGHGGRP